MQSGLKCAPKARNFFGLFFAEENCKNKYKLFEQIGAGGAEFFWPMELPGGGDKGAPSGGGY